MKINELIHGFKIQDMTAIDEIKAKLYVMKHEKSGARLLFLDREDENKTFSITFKTIPEDSTGVFHIIEHSVLCGSKKYTVKEPFVELLKGSLNTFLNAMTFPDKTMYPVASRNDKDFINLMSVYLDAVFHPLILTEPKIFYQEGWHYEFDSDTQALSRSGVVLNEMRGAFSSPDEVASYHIKDMLYPDTCYRYESGGEPEHIPDLTYEKFREAHKKYYHPSNAEIFLDGSVKIDEALSLIDSVLSEYNAEENDFEISDQSPIKPDTREILYEISPSESPENKTKLVIGYLSSRFDEQEKNVAISVLLDAIASSNESPLKKAIIDSGLCEDMNFIPLDSIKQNSINVDFRNVKDGKAGELCNLFDVTVKEICDRGIDKEMLEASLNNYEFRMKERDFGTLPAGIIYAMSALETSLYGGDPSLNLSYEKSFAALREKLDTGYFENLLKSLFTDNNHKATLVMIPSSTLGEEKSKNEADGLEKIKNSLSEDKLQNIIKENEELKAWQIKDDSKEDLEKIPQLSLSDISAEVEKIPEEIFEIDGIKVLMHDVSTNGIIYTELLFDASDLTENEIFDLRVLISLMENVRTEKHSAIDLQNFIKKELGSFDAGATPLTNKTETKLYVSITSSALEAKKQSVIDITSEVLYSSIYTDKETARNIIRQLKLASEEAFISSGHHAGFRRATAYLNVESAIREYYSGYEAHKSIKALEKNFDSAFEKLSERLSALSSRIFTKERLTVSFTGKPDIEFAKSIISAIRHGDPVNPVCKISPLGIRREGIVIPAQASYAELVANVTDFGEQTHGSMSVVRSLLSYGYLWNAVRVQGGAYGVGLIVRNNGNVGFYSYRDPSPERTLGCYREASAFLREFAKSGEDITKFIIGAIGDVSPLKTPKLKGAIALMNYLRGITYDDECKMRKQMLSTSQNDLLSIADTIDKICEQNAVCVIAGKDKLDTCKSLENILYL
jgi:Zn-dependent M16 (insulinase) family peptidase